MYEELDGRTRSYHLETITVRKAGPEAPGGFQGTIAEVLHFHARDSLHDHHNPPTHLTNCLLYTSPSPRDS